MGYRKYDIQLADHVTRKAIIASGGVCYVATANDAAKATIYSDALGTAASNPVALTRGKIEFYVADTVATVDLFIQAPSGHFLVVKGVAASGPNTIYIDKSRSDTTYVIPFSISDTTANTETDTGFDIPDNAAVLPTPFVDVLTADSGMTIAFGTDSNDSGDANGFIESVSLTSTGIVKATNVNGGVTIGSKLYVQDSANSGDDYPEADVSQQGKSLTYTLSASTDTGEGFIIQPMVLPYAALG